MRRIIYDSDYRRTLQEAVRPERGWSHGYASALRRELGLRNIKWAEDYRFLHERTMGPSPSVIYQSDEQGRHGNFHPASYEAILKNPQWKRRLLKKHTTARKALLSHDPNRVELDSCNSSDALLMNIFCHPSVSSSQSGLRSYLGIEPDAELVFGYKPRARLKNGNADCSEIDLRSGNLMIEAKLTETDFQSAHWKLIERYRDLEEVFDLDLLPRDGDCIGSYQLVRGILAAFSEESCRYCLVCDQRRLDLIERWYSVLRAIRLHSQRYRCVLVTWQELSEYVNYPLQIWLREKYGIVRKPVAGSNDCD